MLFLDFSLKNEHNRWITDVLKKTDKLSAFLNYTSMVNLMYPLDYMINIFTVLDYKTGENQKFFTQVHYA